MPLRRELLVILCLGFAFVGVHLARAQEATSANLPDQFQTGEMASTSKPKNKKMESRSQTLAIAPRRKITAAPKQAPATEKSARPILPSGEKKGKPNIPSASKEVNQKPTTVTEQQSPVEAS